MNYLRYVTVAPEAQLIRKFLEYVFTYLKEDNLLFQNLNFLTAAIDNVKVDKICPGYEPLMIASFLCTVT